MAVAGTGILYQPAQPAQLRRMPHHHPTEQPQLPLVDLEPTVQNIGPWDFGVGVHV